MSKVQFYEYVDEFRFNKIKPTVMTVDRFYVMKLRQCGDMTAAKVQYG